ncbi:MAG: hypothetical protein H6809_03155 [Phycisphaeraceae bacterium]|nr:hypothetical protein [Phycisphaeraceae bacterium]
MTGRFSLTLTWVAFAAPCHAQMATIAVTHDHPTGLVQPGESVRIACTLSWTGAYMAARIVGDAESAPDVGIAANVGGPFGPGPLIHYGAPIAGSVRGVDVASTPAFAIPPNPAWLRSEGLEFLHFAWTAPQSAGEVTIDWTPHPGFPDALFFETGASFVPTPLPTTYIGTSLTVVPALPGGACLTVALGAAAFRRRR